MADEEVSQTPKEECNVEFLRFFYSINVSADLASVFFFCYTVNKFHPRFYKDAEKM